jgi:hypothetical protein
MNNSKRRLRSALSLLPISFLLFIGNSCSKADTTVSFKRDLIPLFRQSCTDIGCHIGTNAAAHLQLDSVHAYSQLTSKGLVVAYSTGSSIIYQNMRSDSRPMPPSGKLPTHQTDLVLKWINDGAKDN